MATKSQIDRAVESRLAEASARGAVRRTRGDLAKSVTYDGKRKRLQLELVSGSAVAIPVSQVHGLADAKPSQIRAVKIEGGGYGLHWPALDLDLTVPDLIAGCFGTRIWMSALGRRAGQVTSDAKAAAARENGRKGGRPPLTALLAGFKGEPAILAFEESRKDLQPPRKISLRRGGRRSG